MIPGNIFLAIGERSLVINEFGIVNMPDETGYWERRWVFNANAKYTIKECPQCGVRMVIRQEIPDMTLVQVELTTILCPACKQYRLPVAGPAEIKDIF